MFELINNELNFLNDNTLELKKIEIKGIKVKLVFLDKNLMKVKTMLYEMDWLGPEPKLKFKKDYVKPFNDKYFR
jgi:hypothetical protein